MLTGVAALWLPDCRHMWLLCMYPSPSPGLAVVELTLHGIHRPGHRVERLHGRTRSDHGCLDLQVRRGHQGVSQGHWRNAGLLLFVSVVCVLMHYYYTWQSKRREGTDAPVFKY